MKNKYLWLALGESMLFVLLIWHHYEQWWLRVIQVLMYIIIGIKAMDHFRLFYTNRKNIK